MPSRAFPLSEHVKISLNRGHKFNTDLVMEKETLNAWIMYHEVQRLDRLGFSKNKISTFLKANWRTISKYLNMSEEEYEFFLLKTEKAKILNPYKNFILSRLQEFPDTSSAQMFDWLKEHHQNLPEVSEKTVYNFVMDVRHKHGIPIVKPFREYFPIEELPYGQQAQVDLGQYNMLSHGGSRKKVYFFAMVLSRSRMKFVWFLDKSFTAKNMCIAHEMAFEYFCGIPQTIVYDQDCTLIVDENIGDIILTQEFRAYTKSRNFHRHFCRKADPESKGKIENVIGYVKKNFLYNRRYFDLETLNKQALDWLERTGNKNIHNLTRKRPSDEILNERLHLQPYTPLTIETNDKMPYVVRKNNVINYKSNFYSLPEGTYQGRSTQVMVKEKQDRFIEIFSSKDDLICSHSLSSEKGKMIINTNHRRDKSEGITQMMETVSQYFTDKEKAILYFKKIQENIPRYIRDHLQVIKRAVKEIPVNVVDSVLNFCMKNANYNGHDFENVLIVFSSTNVPVNAPLKIKLLDGGSLDKANETPQVSDINEYYNILTENLF